MPTPLLAPGICGVESPHSEINALRRNSRDHWHHDGWWLNDEDRAAPRLPNAAHELLCVTVRPGTRNRKAFQNTASGTNDVFMFQALPVRRPASRGRRAEGRWEQALVEPSPLVLLTRGNVPLARAARSIGTGTEG